MPRSTHRAKTLKELPGDREGAALVEFTVLMPMLLLLLAGFIEFGIAIQQYHLVQKSMRDATRYLARVPHDKSTLFDATSCNAAPTGEVLKAKNLVIYGNVAGTGTAKLADWTYDDICVTGPTSQTVTFNTVSTDVYVVGMSTAVPYTDLGFLSILGLTGFTLRGSHEQAFIGE